MVIYIFFIVILLFIAVVFAGLLFNILFRGYAPFVSTRGEVIKRIFENLELERNYGGVVYELGCGKAGFLQFMSDELPNTKLVGVENTLFPYLIARTQVALRKDDRMKIIKQDVFKINLSEANIVYCYLNHGMMKSLEKKFQKECKKGTIVISYNYSLPNINLDKEEQVGEDRIYFYKI